MTTKNETPNPAASLSAAQAEQAAADELAKQAAEQRAKADAARQRWAEGVLADEAGHRRAALQAVTVAQTAFETSPATPETIIPTWMQLQRAQSALYAVERARERAMALLGKPSREPKVPHPSFSTDVDRLLNRWALEQIGGADEATHEVLAAVSSGRKEPASAQ